MMMIPNMLGVLSILRMKELPRALRDVFFTKLLIKRKCVQT